MAESLSLNWDVLLTEERENNAQVPEFEIDKTPNGSDIVSTLDNHKLAEKIKRLRTSMSSGITKNLPDNGEKLRRNLKELEDELSRREKHKKSRQDTETSSPSNPASSSGYHHHFSPMAKKSSSFGYMFNKKLDEREGEIWKSSSRNKNRIRRKSEEQLNQFKTKNNYGSLPLKSLGNSGDKFNNCNVRELPNAGKNRDCGLFKRMTFFVMSITRSLKKPSEDSCAFGQRSEKVKDVVLLDDEEAEAEAEETYVLLSEDTLTECKSVKRYYPSRDDPEAIELTSSDIQCLNPGTYLTSPIMNFYIRYLQKLVSPADRNEDYHFFNTYFYKKLLDDISFKGNKDEQFLKLRRWWKGVNIFQKAYIFLPIHGDMHWSLVIICMPDKEYEVGPVMLHLDSLGIHSSDKIFKDVKYILKEEWMYLKNNEPSVDLPFCDMIWEDLPAEIVTCSLTVPQQKNDYDCGLFVLYFMKKFIKEAPKRFQRDYLQHTFGRAAGKNWFEPRKASRLRKKIKHLLGELCETIESDMDEALESPAHFSSSSRSEPRELIDIN